MKTKEDFHKEILKICNQNIRNNTLEARLNETANKLAKELQAILNNFYMELDKTKVRILCAPLGMGTGGYFEESDPLVKLDKSLEKLLITLNKANYIEFCKAIEEVRTKELYPKSYVALEVSIGIIISALIIGVTFAIFPPASIAGNLGSFILPLLMIILATFALASACVLAYLLNHKDFAFLKTMEITKTALLNKTDLENLDVNNNGKEGEVPDPAARINLLLAA